MATFPNQAPDDRELEQIFQTTEESEAQVVQGLLESAGIDALVTGENPADILPVGTIAVRVPAEDAEEARHIISEDRANPPAEDQDVPEA
jgi:hypothetical protein